VKKVRVHKRAAENFAAVFDDLASAGMNREITELGGVYNARVQRGSDSNLSLHTWAIAIDLNLRTNRLGTHGNMSGEVIAIFAKRGFYWGGQFHRPDPQHFQLCTKY